MNILTMLKSDRAFNKFINHYSDFEFENIKQFETLQEKIVTSDWEIAIIDKDIFINDKEFNEASQFLTTNDVKVFFFEGTFSTIIESIDLYINEKKALEEAIKEEEKKHIKEVIKIVEVPVEVEKEVFKTEYKHIYTEFPNKKIGIMNLSKGAGSTFITTNLAFMLAEYKLMTTVIETPTEKSKIFTNLCFEGKCDDRNISYRSIMHDISLGVNKIEKGFEFIVDDVNFLVADVRLDDIDVSNWNYAKIFKVLNLANKSKITLIDINNSFFHKSIQDIIEDLDYLMVIIEPIPTEVLLNSNTLEILNELNKESNKVKFIINKYNEGVIKKDLEKYLQIPILANIPYMPINLVYKAFYEGNALYHYEEIKNDLKNSFTPILREIVPISLIRKNDDNIDENKKNKFRFFKKSKKE